MKSVTLLTAFLFIGFGMAIAVPFKLYNGNLRSIPLVIPNVMNPNLYPMSLSGVDLAVGQEIFFFANGKKGAGKKRYLLLTVTEELRDKELNVGQLIEARKKELGLK